MRKADAKRVTRAAKKVNEAFELFENIDYSMILRDYNERRDYDYFRDQLYNLSTKLDTWQEQMQREAGK